jgi:hypothetical protein
VALKKGLDDDGSALIALFILASLAVQKYQMMVDHWRAGTGYEMIKTMAKCSQSRHL